MRTYDIGDLVRLTGTFRNAAGVLTDPTTVTCRIERPDETETVYLYGTDVEVVRDSAGIFHVDVVPANPGEWSHPPFSGDVVDGEIWGRGALDMKAGVAMIVAACLLLEYGVSAAAVAVGWSQYLNELFDNLFHFTIPTAFAQAPEQGGIDGRQVTAIIEDTESQAEVGKDKAKKLIEEDEVFAIVVLDRLENQEAIGKYLNDREIPTISVVDASQRTADFTFNQVMTYGIRSAAPTTGTIDLLGPPW